MEWVPSSNGQIPKGRNAVEGGYEVSICRTFQLAINLPRS